MFFRQAVSLKQINGLIIAPGRRFLSKGFTTGTFNKTALKGQRSNYNVYDSWVGGEQTFLQQAETGGFILHTAIDCLCKTNL